MPVEQVFGDITDGDLGSHQSENGGGRETNLTRDCDLRSVLETERALQAVLVVEYDGH